MGCRPERERAYCDQLQRWRATRSAPLGMGLGRLSILIWLPDYYGQFLSGNSAAMAPGYRATRPTSVIKMLHKVDKCQLAESVC